MRIEHFTATIGNLMIDQWIHHTTGGIFKNLSVMRLNKEGDYWEELPQSDPDFSKAVIHLHNQKSNA